MTQPARSAQPAQAVVESVSSTTSGSHLTNDETRGLVLGFVGVLCFSASLPFTRVAVREFGVIIVVALIVLFSVAGSRKSAVG